jgi:mono/diheme cytochrome c family protein
MPIKPFLFAIALAISAPLAAQDTPENSDSSTLDCPEPGSGEWRGRRGYHEGGRHAGGHRGGHGMRGGQRGPRTGGAGRGRNCGGGGRQHWVIPDNEARELNPIEVSSESLARGRAIYSENCQRCHGEFGFGDGPDASDLSVRPVPLRHAARMHSDGELNYIIRTGREPMPSWQERLTQDQRWDVINFIRYDIGARRGPPFAQKRSKPEPANSEHDMSGHDGMHGGMGMHEDMMQHHEQMDHSSMNHDNMAHDAMEHDMSSHHDDKGETKKDDDAQQNHH